MTKDLVIGIDSSTTATKAIAFDRAGRIVVEGRASVNLLNPHPGWFEQESSEWWDSMVESLRQVTSHVSAERIAAIAISNQRETFVPLDEHDRPVRAGTVWLDERAKVEVQDLIEIFGADGIHHLTGKPCDVTPCIYRLLWMKKREPELFKRFRKITEVHAYLTYRLTGKFLTSVSSADPAGFLNLGQWTHADELMNAVGLERKNFPGLAHPGEIMGTLTAEATAATGLRPGTPVVAGGGDGQCAGTGVNVFEPGRAYVNMGTALVSGVYSQGYGIDRAFRTMGAIAEEGYIFESVLRSGTFLVNWIVHEMFRADPQKEPDVYKILESEAAVAGIGAGGILLLPYWVGVMTPYWRSEARGVMAGLSGSHKRGHVYRAVLEGLCFEQALATDKAAEVTGKPIDHYVAIGGGSVSDLWCQILADASGRNVLRSSTVEASSLGAAMAAAKGAGWFHTIRDASAAMAGDITRLFTPDAKAHDRYRELIAIYRDLWPMMANWNERLSAFADSGVEA